MHKNHKPLVVDLRTELNKWCWTVISAPQKPMEVTFGMIHGDFHLRNILIRDDVPTVIDFAKSDIGPLAVDYAKLIVDILYFTEIAEINNDIFEMDQLSKSTLSPLIELITKQLTSRDDNEFLQYAIRHYSSAYISYPDVDEGKKSLFKKLLK